ncbi:bacteriohopanetetrol glucosamine biosynthesis glycosyltransferase HpnI [Kozakia baliensis]|uniref:bacteriohopanetetrol glucosamine biosynthesis glycosyltransferase HpnI n=2 Tax=Kozakia baliensis TaxID=153496 RepID=UPI000B0C6963|nr:bacteriohopanetetrol glucosamine biosynthesis glycosyltransferase HpnI [Kozakia baliensis]
MLAALTWLGFATAGVAMAGCVQSVVGASLIGLFRRNEQVLHSHSYTNGALAPVTVLKPLHGDEPLLKEALESFCVQDYPEYQIVFGVQRLDDPAIAYVRDLQQRYPERDLELVVNIAQHGTNRKVGNLINMFAKARHDILIVSDSDIHVEPQYLRDVVETLAEPKTGLVTTLYAGLPASTSLVRQLCACQINQNFMPGVMMSRLLGRRDCLGATMALTRETLTRVGGLEVLADHVADDAILGQRVRALGLNVELAPCMTWTTVAETTFNEMMEHELRWGRTVKNLEPVGYGLSSIQLPLFWATVTLICCWPMHWAWMFFLGVWIVRALAALGIDAALGRLNLFVLPLLPIREWLSAAVMVGSARGQRVEWRGQTLHIKRPSTMTSHQPLEPGD